MGVQIRLHCVLLTESFRTSPIKSVTPNYPGKVIIKMGMMPRIPQPEAETFADHRHPWQGKHDGLDQYKIKIFQEKVATTGA